MTDLFLMRHGQAAFGSDHYDRLSELGRLQARTLGRYCQAIGLRPDRVCSGRLQRQLDTARLAFPAISTPDSTDAFNEYDADALLLRYIAVLEPFAVHQPQDLKRLSGSPAGFQAALDAVLRAWIADHRDDSGFESWRGFSERIDSGLTEIVSTAGKQDCVVIATSAGVVARVLSQVLKTGEEGFIAFNRRIYNASLTHIVYGRNGYSLQGFNNIAAQQLAAAGQVTFR